LALLGLTRYLSPMQRCQPRQSPARFGALVCIVLLVPSAARPDEPASRRTWTERVEHRFYLSPGIQFGARSQELSLSFAHADVAQGMLVSDPVPFVDSRSFGVRLNLVGSEWSPAAVHGLIFLSRTAWVGFSWPMGFEVAAGYGGGSGSGYGIGQLSYIAGIASRIELAVTLQTTVGTTGPRPGWLSSWLFGLRYGFDVARPRRSIVTTELEP